MGELFHRNVADFIMNRRYRMCYEYVRWISFAATSNCPMVINLYTRQNRWSIRIFPSLSLSLFFSNSSSPLDSTRFILSYSVSVFLFPFSFFFPLFFSCFDYPPLLSRFNFNFFCSDYKANSIFHIQSIGGRERRGGARERRLAVSIEANEEVQSTC